MTPNPAERWVRWQKEHEDPTPEEDQQKDWARRGDGALMLQDQDGWFVMHTNEEGTITAQSDTDPTPFPVYCEPVWLSWAADAELERDAD